MAVLNTLRPEQNRHLIEFIAERKRNILIQFTLKLGYIGPIDHKIALVHVVAWWLFGVKPMMTSSNENIFRVAGHLCGEFTGHRWIPRTMASDAELWCFCLIRVWMNGWVNNHEAGDLRCNRVHCDVTVMIAWNSNDTGRWRVCATRDINALSIVRIRITLGKHFELIDP